MKWHECTRIELFLQQMMTDGPGPVRPLGKAPAIQIDLSGAEFSVSMIDAIAVIFQRSTLHIFLQLYP